MDQNRETQTDRSLSETIEVAGSQLVDKVRALVEEGNIRTLKVVARDGDTKVEMPLTIGVVAGGVVTLAAPWLAVLGVIAALVAKVRIEVERDTDAGSGPDAGKQG